MIESKGPKIGLRLILLRNLCKALSIGVLCQTPGGCVGVSSFGGLPRRPRAPQPPRGLEVIVQGDPLRGVNFWERPRAAWMLTSGNVVQGEKKSSSLVSFFSLFLLFLGGSEPPRRSVSPNIGYCKILYDKKTLESPY